MDTITETLSIRMTNKYVGTYAHMDEWEDIGTIEVVCVETDVDEEDMCESTVRKYEGHVTLDAPRSDDDVKKAIQTTFGRHGCAHEYDCCGCWSSYVGDIRKVGPDRWYFDVCSSRNY